MTRLVSALTLLQLPATHPAALSAKAARKPARRTTPADVQRMVSAAVAAAVANMPNPRATATDAALEALDMWPNVKSLTDPRLRRLAIHAIAELPPAIRREVVARGVTLTDHAELPAGRMGDAGENDVRLSRAALASLDELGVKTVLWHELAHVVEGHFTQAVKATGLDSFDRMHFDARHERAADAAVSTWGMYKAYRRDGRYDIYEYLD